MSHNEFRADSALDISVERADDESGSIMLTIEADGDVIVINVGRSDDDASQLADELDKSAKSAQAIADDWEIRPDEYDAYVYDSGRDGYTIMLEGQVAKDGRGRIRSFPTRDIATYELAKAMAEAGCFPDAWYVNERGGTENISEAVRKYHDEGGDKLLPLPGVRFEEGADVLVPAEDWHHWVADRDYGDLGIVIHTYGDPDVTILATHEQVQPYPGDES